ncbi:YdeI/OmpD-associated family protein [Pedobacter sp. SL55]|uniref:YdeI/OmpD-associated family protein n=1 Tax=Pedobacter sp. SL55 TaxID=2995161 RepID=UPI00226DACA0|nr:YdeI/OmpD-associated family protein [Pedobacter sp. SL55]WAC40262.1 YdeI/OmpD-associated family protein [Pedobacter sp. SL55]
MVQFNAEIEKFESNGEKTGWSYIFIPETVAQQIKSGDNRSFRVRGQIDNLQISGKSLLPMGDGDFILPLDGKMRKQLKKEAGQPVSLSLEHDIDYKVEMPEDLEICLAQEDGVLEQFLSYTKSHQNYFINWLNTAKTEVTRTKRLVMIVNAMALKQDFGLMLRSNKRDR